MVSIRLECLTVNANNSDTGPTLPTNIVIIIIPLDMSPKNGVMPVVSPTVLNAETISNNMFRVPNSLEASARSTIDVNKITSIIARVEIDNVL